ncbi:MAG: hypothetical protein J5552_02400 [Prevotella sp.]|nr:hypothetical protein [Prevotella sp.]
MKRLLIYIYALAALLLASCTGDHHQQMLAQLEELERQNVADSLMTNDSLALALADFFDRHGTPNEQLRAHYILGRTYADMGEAPAAIEAYLDAATRADTTASDCDWAKLSRVHAQSALLYHRLVQPRSQLQELGLAIDCATKVGDSLMTIACFSQKADAYSQLHIPDSVIYFREKASQMYASIGNLKRSATAISGAVPPLLDINNVKKAKTYMDKFESSSGQFDDKGNIAKGREIYYYVKGRYYLAISNVDSAEFMFRLLARKGYSLNHKIASCKGLQEVFSRKGVADSIAKYAELGYQLNDSAYSLSEMENIQRLKFSYNYNRHQQMALKQTAKARAAHLMLMAAVSLLIILALAFLAYYWRSRARKNQFEKRLLEYQQMLERRQAPSTQSQNDAVAERPNTLLESKLRKALVERIEKGNSETVKATDEEWLQMEEEVNLAYPDFNERLAHYLPNLNQVHFKICLGIKFGLEPSQIAVLVSRSKQAVSNARSRMYRKAFGIDGTTDDFDQFIESF